MYKDPVCGMEVKDEQFTFEISGKKYFFCCQGCLEKFKEFSAKGGKKYVYDLVIIGAGPAGLTAAVHASVLKIDTLLIAKNIGGQAVDSAKIKNYMGFDFVTGKELIDKFEHQFLHEHYSEHKIDEVIKVNRKGDIFEILTKGGDAVTAYTLIIATGVRQKVLGIPGEERLLRRGVSYYLLQEARLFKGTDAVVVGAGNFVFYAVSELKDAGCNVSLITKYKITANSFGIKELKKSNKVKIFEGYDIIEIKGEDKVESVIIRCLDGSITKEILCSGVFIQTDFLPNTEFFRELVKLNGKGEIIINSNCSTSSEGIFACGDVTNSFGKRIIIASGEGAKACLSAKKYLLKMGI